MCISCFSNCMTRAKDSLLSRRRFIQRFLRNQKRTGRNTSGAKKKGLPVEEGLKRCGNTPDGHFSARPIPRDPGISPCTNDRQVSWLSGHHSTAPSHFRNGILRHYSPVHSDEIVQDLHLFPFNPLTRGLRGQRHPSFCVFGSISLYHACEKKQSFFTSVTVEICRIPPSSTSVILSQNAPLSVNFTIRFLSSIFDTNLQYKEKTA